MLEPAAAEAPLTLEVAELTKEADKLAVVLKPGDRESTAVETAAALEADAELDPAVPTETEGALAAATAARGTTGGT